MQQGTKTNIKLGKDINTNDEENHKYGLTTYDRILVGNTVTLDLNGKKLTLNSGQNQVSSYINVTLGNLTVQDSVGGGEIFLNDEYRGGSTLILLLDTATFTLKSGTIRATTKPETSGIDLIQSYGTVNIEGGTLTCTQTNGEIGRLHSDPNHWTSCYALKCLSLIHIYYYLYLLHTEPTTRKAGFCVKDIAKQHFKRKRGTKGAKKRAGIHSHRKNIR